MIFCFSSRKQKKTPEDLAIFRGEHEFMAQSLGFEPRVGYQPTHDFQSCALDHSANSARQLLLNQRSLLYPFIRQMSIPFFKKVKISFGMCVYARTLSIAAPGRSAAAYRQSTPE